MTEDSAAIPPEDKPRFLLPAGCKDLIDALRLQRLGDGKSSAENIAPLQSSTEPPPSIWIREPITVRDLATALRLPAHRVIAALMQSDIFAHLTTEIDFKQASAVCWRYGVIVHKVS